MKLIFNQQGVLLVTTSGVIPSSHSSSDYIIAELAEGEVFDFKYNYIINQEGFATRGELKEIDYTEIAKVEADIAATKYQRDRASAYPALADQLDTLYHGGYDAWRAQVDAVKQQYPKPTGGSQ